MLIQKNQHSQEELISMHYICLIYSLWYHNTMSCQKIDIIFFYSNEVAKWRENIKNIFFIFPKPNFCFIFFSRFSNHNLVTLGKYKRSGRWYCEMGVLLSWAINQNKKFPRKEHLSCFISSTPYILFCLKWDKED